MLARTRDTTLIEVGWFKHWVRHGQIGLPDLRLETLRFEKDKHPWSENASQE